MAKHRFHSIEFKRQIAQEFLAGDTLHRLEKRHDISRNLIRVWSSGIRPAPSTRTPRRPISFGNTKPGSPPSNGWSASRRWNWNF
jgi:transposase-like protein